MSKQGVTTKLLMGSNIGDVKLSKDGPAITQTSAMEKVMYNHNQRVQVVKGITKSSCKVLSKLSWSLMKNDGDAQGHVVDLVHG